MNDVKEKAKIQKLAAKRKSDAILKIMKGSDAEMTAYCLDVFAQINDETSCNAIAHYLESSDDSVKLAACKAALEINTDYMKTHVRHILSKETDSDMKEKIQEMLNASKRIPL